MLLLAAATLASGLPTFNVRDFGAVGDATTDDTAAFQAAIDNATAAARDLPFEGFSLQSRAELFIPRGHYRLTRTLTLARLAPDLRGESRPVLRMDDAAQDIIFGSAVWRWQATGLHLAGGKNQLHVGNNNTDRGQILIADCTFTASAGAAIRLLEPSRELQPPRVGKLAAHRGAPTHELRLFGGSFSTHVAIRDVVFEECVQALVNWADWTTLDNAWITTARAMPNDTAVIENHDRLFATNVLGVPHEERGPGSQQRWVDNYAYRSGGGTVVARAFRFGGEGNGMGGFWNFSPFACHLVRSPYSHLDLCERIPHNATVLPPNTSVIPGSALTLADSLVDTHENPVLTLVEVPNALSIRANQMRYVRQPLIRVWPDGDLTAPAFSLQFALAASFKDDPLLRYDVTSNTNWNGPPHPEAQLPQEMLPFSASAGRDVADAPPTRGVWAAGAILRATTPTKALAGWVCTAGGTPGTWEAFGLA